MQRADPIGPCRVQRHNPETDVSVEIGSVGIAADGQLALLSARPPYQAWLAGVVRQLNGDALWRECAGSEAPLPRVQQHLARRYGLRLTPIARG